MYRLLSLPVRSLPQARPALQHRAFSVSLARMAEGSTGSLRSGGSARSDAFNRREKAAEDMYIREREKEMMKILRDKIGQQEALLDSDRRLLASLEEACGEESEQGWRQAYSKQV